MKPIALILEDNPNALAARATIFKKLGMTVVTAQSLEEAKRKFAYTPSIDLVVCDYNLDVDNPENDEGVIFARELRELGFMSPMVLYSGQDGVDLASQLAPKDEGSGRYNVSPETPFEYSAQKATMPGEEQLEWMAAAVNNAETKREQGLGVVSSFAKKYDLSAMQFNELLRLVPGNTVELSLNNQVEDKLPAVNAEFETEFRKSGFKVVVVTHSFIQDQNLPEIALKKPLMIWVRKIAEGYYSEALGCSELRATSQNEHEAISSLLLALLAAETNKDASANLQKFASSQFN